MRNALFTALVALLLAVPCGAVAAGKSILVHKTDGTTVAGELLEQNSRGFLVKAEDGLFLVEFDDVKHVEYGADEAAAEPEAPAEPPPPAAEAAPAGEPAADAPPPEAPPSESSDLHAAPDANAWVVIRRTDGSTVSGTLIEQTDDAMIVQSGQDLVTIPRSEVSRVASGDLSAPDEPASSPGWADAVPPPPIAPADPLEEARGRPEFSQYSLERLQMLDPRGYWLGPRTLRYPKAQFGSDDGDPFYVVVQGEPEYRLTFPEFLDLTGHDGLRNRYDKALAQATARSQVGMVMLAVGGGLLVATGVSMGVGASGVDSGLGLGIGTPLLVAGIPHVAVGSAVLAMGDVRKKELAGFDLQSLFRRKQAYKGIQQYNAHLRERYDLPEDEALDSPAE